jgi:hypothetical protein
MSHNLVKPFKQTIICLDIVKMLGITLAHAEEVQVVKEE